VDRQLQDIGEESRGDSESITKTKLLLVGGFGEGPYLPELLADQGYEDWVCQPQGKRWSLTCRGAAIRGLELCENHHTVQTHVSSYSFGIKQPYTNGEESTEISHNLFTSIIPNPPSKVIWFAFAGERIPIGAQLSQRFKLTGKSMTLRGGHCKDQLVYSHLTREQLMESLASLDDQHLIGKRITRRLMIPFRKKLGLLIFGEKKGYNAPYTVTLEFAGPSIKCKLTVERGSKPLESSQIVLHAR